jgi:hypothetical protein
MASNTKLVQTKVNLKQVMELSNPILEGGLALVVNVKIVLLKVAYPREKRTTMKITLLKRGILIK